MTDIFEAPPTSSGRTLPPLPSPPPQASRRREGPETVFSVGVSGKMSAAGTDNIDKYVVFLALRRHLAYNRMADRAAPLVRPRL